MPKRHIFNKNSTLVVKRLKYLFWLHTVLSISKLRDVAKAVKSLEIPAFPKLIFQDSFCVISFLDAQDRKKEGRFQAKVLGSVLFFWYNSYITKNSTGREKSNVYNS